MAAPSKPHPVAVHPPLPQVANVFKLDEGYSEDSRSQMGSDMDTTADPAALDENAHNYTAATHDWILSLPAELRAGMPPPLCLLPDLDPILTASSRRVRS